ncbi:hypothetical protein VOLCADRAFT_105794 [Volvox carteri f. nagariensis]|uniref:tRNA (guanine(46)-N(7))-methyltransferase n=1 Tax=Volvox carteri f. nagariensis TaxID=3068 RepID=D8U350_VOLCA|nr:uncharacterized protein VOLCADRAFT_105794 [Volvox carteri f. nagariensis]EFJ45917.1 hypothetical protein VOLCADRAFT_105794 [Volvox carteri f. nagariensis]|eukprot:XP_002952995.1 hypothetical protein VOLCADRAFT_105794 [Volvox carteri f. nagariensis]
MSPDGQQPIETVNWSAIYEDPTRPLIVDLGCGAGRYIVLMAHRKGRGNNYLGVDVHKALLDRANGWAASRSLSGNVHFLQANAVISAGSLLASYPGPVELVSVQFPDPQQRRQRHIVGKELVEALAQVLKPRARVYLASDFEDTATYMRNAFERYGRECFRIDDVHTAQPVVPCTSVSTDLGVLVATTATPTSRVQSSGGFPVGSAQLYSGCSAQAVQTPSLSSAQLQGAVDGEINRQFFESEEKQDRGSEGQASDAADEDLLFFKGSWNQAGWLVLVANQDLAKAGLAHGAKLMLLLSDGTAVATQGQQALQQQKKAKQEEAAQRVRDLYAQAKGLGGAAATAIAAAAAATAAAASVGPAIDWQERKRIWEKTGEAGWRMNGLLALFFKLEGETGAASRLADLSHNRLCRLPASLACLTSLHTLRLDHNQLTAEGLPWSALSQLTALTALSLDCNGGLERVPEEGIVGLQALQARMFVLSLNRNLLTHLPEGLCRLRALRVLSADGNRLEALPDGLGGCTSLEELSAEGNRIRHLPPSLALLTRLQTVRLDNNMWVRITAVPPAVLRDCASLATLSLQGNPITADQLRSTPGFAEYDTRRVARCNKQLGAGVLEHAARTFTEGAEDRQWSRWGGDGGGGRAAGDGVVKGCWQLSGGHRGDRTSDRTSGLAAVEDFGRFAAAGITTFDAADHYGPAETLIGRYLATDPDRRPPNTQVLTKYCVFGRRDMAGINREAVKQAVNLSRSRLGVDRVDLMQFYWGDYDVNRYVDGALYLSELASEGLIRHVGVTNFDVPRMDAMVRAGVYIASNQLQYSLLDRRPENGMAQFCAANGIALLSYGVLAGGFLSDKYLGMPANKVSVDTYSKGKYAGVINAVGGWDWFQSLLQALDIVARKHDTTISNVAARWVLDRPGVAAVILGARNADHVQDQVRLFGFTLDEQDQAAIQEVLDRGRRPRSDCYTWERGGEW